MTTCGIDINIEARERCISFLSDDIDYCKLPDGRWVAANDWTTSRYAHHVAEQAVLFAIKEGF